MLILNDKEKNLLHYNSGFRKVTFRYDLLNYDEAKIGELSATGGSLGLNSLAQIKRKGRFGFKDTEINDVDWLNDKIRPVFILNDKYEYSLGVFMISSPTRRLSNRGIYRDVEAYDTSLILLEDKFDNRYKIAKDTNYITAIGQIINSAGIWKVDIPYYAALVKTDREFEIGTSKLEAVNYLLQEINYTSVWVDERGYFRASPYIQPADRATEYTYKNNEMSIIRPDGISEEIDLFNVPNKWVVVASNPETESLLATYTNTNGASPTSTVSRRRTIVDYRQVDDMANQEVLTEYVRRIAYEASNVYGKFIFSTALMPHHSYMDALFCEHSHLGIAYKYIETSWEMDLIQEGSMTHNCRRVIQI